MTLPALQSLAEGGVRPNEEIYDGIASALGLDEADRNEKLPKTNKSRFRYRAQEALSHLAKAGLVERVQLGSYRIAPAGSELLEKQPERIDRKVLKTYDSYREWNPKKAKPRPDKDADQAAGASDAAGSSDADLDQFGSTVGDAVKAAILREVRKSSAVSLDRIMAALMAAAGYSRSGGEASRSNKRGPQDESGGSQWIDPLGVVKVYLQTDNSPRSSPVGEQALREFVATMVGTDQGVFVTTSTFSAGATDYVSQSPMRIALIDGEGLANLLAKYRIWGG